MEKGEADPGPARPTAANDNLSADEAARAVGHGAQDERVDDDDVTHREERHQPAADPSVGGDRPQREVGVGGGPRCGPAMLKKIDTSIQHIVYCRQGRPPGVPVSAYLSHLLAFAGAARGDALDQGAPGQIGDRIPALGPHLGPSTNESRRIRSPPGRFHSPPSPEPIRRTGSPSLNVLPEDRMAPSPVCPPIRFRPAAYRTATEPLTIRYTDGTEPQWCAGHLSGAVQWFGGVTYALTKRKMRSRQRWRGHGLGVLAGGMLARLGVLGAAGVVVTVVETDVSAEALILGLAGFLFALALLEAVFLRSAESTSSSSPPSSGFT